MDTRRTEWRLERSSRHSSVKSMEQITICCRRRRLLIFSLHRTVTQELSCPSLNATFECVEKLVMAWETL